MQFSSQGFMKDVRLSLSIWMWKIHKFTFELIKKPDLTDALIIYVPISPKSMQHCYKVS